MKIYVHPKASTAKVVRRLERRTGLYAVVEQGHIRLIPPKPQAPAVPANDHPPFGGDAA